MGTAPYTPGGLSNSKLKLADAVAGNVKSGKKFYAGDKTLKTGTWVPVFVQVGSNKSHGEDAPRINVTVSGYSEYYCFHTDLGGSNNGALSWSSTEGTFQGNTGTGNGTFKKLVGCNPSHNVTISTFFNHDTGGWARTLVIWAIK